MADPERADVALATGAGDTAYGRLVVAEPDWGAAPRVALRGGVEQVLRRCLAAWAADGSVVIGRGVSSRDAERLASESVTVDARD